MPIPNYQLHNYDSWDKVYCSECKTIVISKAGMRLSIAEIKPHNFITNKQLLEIIIKSIHL